MKKIYQIVLLLLTFIIMGNRAYTRQYEASGPRFSGSFKNSSLTNPKFGMMYVKNWWFSGDASIPVPIDSNANFKAQLPDLKKPYKVRIGTRKANGKLYWTCDYFAESGDDVHIEFIKRGEGDSVVFTGKGAEKYNLVTKLDQAKASFHKEWRRFRITSVQNPVRLDSLIDEAASLVKITTANINHLIDNTVGVTEEMKSVFKQEFVNYYSCHFLFILDYIYGRNKNNPLILSEVRKSFNEFKSLFNTKANIQSILCPEYLWQLSRVEQYNLRINGAGDDAELSQLYHVIKLKYTGEVRERMFTHLLVKPYYYKDLTYINTIYDSVANETIKFLTIPFFKEQVTQLVRLKRGATAFNGVFKDVNGRAIDIQSFKGKAVFIDVWFLGCAGCATFHKRFHQEIYPQFKHNKDFVYLSLNIDRKKENWIKGMHSGLYTADEYINLRTEELGLDHPFTKYYNIKGGPSLLLIDKNGRIYGRPTAALSNAEISKWITDAMSIKNAN